MAFVVNINRSLYQQIIETAKSFSQYNYSVRVSGNNEDIIINDELKRCLSIYLQKCIEDETFSDNFYWVNNDLKKISLSKFDAQMLRNIIFSNAQSLIDVIDSCAAQVESLDESGRQDFNVLSYFTQNCPWVS